ncbi:hypothetical protein F4677DRAFT_429519 [Hypoxylon crocopeplum]|nr:hypothetical protein F4677DRAFT_429519 [Hypoxylon crocopeplum]
MTNQAVFTGPSFEITPLNTTLFGGDYVSAAAPSATINNEVNYFESSITNAPNLTCQSATQGITTHIVVNIVSSSNVTASKNSTSRQQVDSVPERITIDTILPSVRPQVITQA